MLAKIYVPSKENEILEDLAKRVSEWFGGCTLVPNCKGFWLNDSKELVKDEITIIEAYFNERELTKGKAQLFLVNLASFIKRRLKQTCVLYTIDSEAYFYWIKEAWNILRF